MMHRRRFLLTSLAGAVAVPRAVGAQYRTGTVPRVGILNSDTAQDARVDEFRDGLRKLGYVEGQNLLITYRWADGHLDRLPALADDLLASHVDVIVAIGASVWAAKRKTNTVPIVMAFSGDPVGTAMVSNLARPGGNITGLSFMSSDLAAKRLELLKQTFPRIARVAVLYLPAEVSTAPELRETEAAARTINVTLQPLGVRHPDDLEPLFAKATRERADALLVFAHAFAFVHRDRIVELSARQRLPTMFGWREFVDVGGLMSYGPNVHAMLRRAAAYVDRILKGAKPGDLPIEQPTKFELVINLKTAKAHGLTIPPSLLAQADQVIE
jgi:putative tryptophan/tyrosine transport system substrate-binding protein